MKIYLLKLHEKNKNCNEFIYKEEWKEVEKKLLSTWRCGFCATKNSSTTNDIEVGGIPLLENLKYILWLFFTFSFLSILFSLFLSFHAIVWYSQNKTTIIQWQLRMIFDGFLVQFVGSFWHFLCKIWKTKIKLTF